ncbi:MAG: glycosyltransferase family 39 protein [Candidatus Omnitrophota bacterium]
MRDIMILLALTVIIFFAGNNILPLTNPDEVFYAGTASEMANHGTWVTPYIFGQPQFEKPILTYDLIRIAFLMFGQTSFAARFFPALFALLGVLSVYFLGRLLYADRRKAFMGAFVLMTSAFYIGMAKTVFTDMIFSVWILLSLTAFYTSYIHPQHKRCGLLLFHIFAALAVLTKGPLGYLIPLATIILFLSCRGEQKFLHSKAFGFGVLILILIALPWYLLMFNLYGNAFTHEFFYNDHWRRLLTAEHSSNDSWYFYPGAMVGGMFPWMFITLISLWQTIKAFYCKKPESFQQFLLIWILVVLGIFEPAHSKLMSYILPLFPAMALLAGGYLVERSDKIKNVGWSEWATFGLFLLIPLAFPIFVMKYPMYLPSMLHLKLLAAIEILFLILLFIFIYSKKIRWVLYSFGLQVPLLLFLILTASAHIKPYVSSQEAVEYLMHDRQIDGKIAASKFFIRGVKYFSGKDVVLLNFSNSNFFSPHPVLELNTPAKLRDFLGKQPLIYAVINKHTWGELKDISKNNGFHTELLAQIGDAFVVEITLISKVLPLLSA